MPVSAANGVTVEHIGIRAAGTAGVVHLRHPAFKLQAQRCLDFGVGSSPRHVGELIRVRDQVVKLLSRALVVGTSVKGADDRVILVCCHKGLGGAAIIVLVFG